MLGRGKNLSIQLFLPGKYIFSQAAQDNGRPNKNDDFVKLRIFSI